MYFLLTNRYLFWPALFGCPIHSHFLFFVHFALLLPPFSIHPSCFLITFPFIFSYQQPIPSTSTSTSNTPTRNTTLFFILTPLQRHNMMRQAFQRIQGVTDVGVLCKEGVRSTISTFTSKKATPSSAPHGVLMDDTPTKAFNSPPSTLNKRFVGITGPSLIGDAFGFQSQAFLMTLGNLACTRSSEDPSKWLGVQQGTPERLLLQADDQQFYRHDRLDASSMRQAFLIHQDIEFYLNGSLSIYRDNRTVKTLGTILNFLHGKICSFLASIPDSVALVRCDIPFYNPLHQESKEIIEQVVVEYFRSPWTMQWGRRVRRAQVQKTHSWYLSLANGTENLDESFHDGDISNHKTQPIQVTTAPLSGTLMPIAANSPGSDALMDIDTQPLVTPDRSGYTALVQPIAPVLPSVSVSPVLSHLSITIPQSMDSSSSNLETTDLDGDDEEDYTSLATHNPTDNDSSNGNGSTSDQSLPNDNANTNVESAKPFPCPYPGCFLSFSKKGNLGTHHKKHTGTTYPCTYFPCTHTSTQDTDRIRHERVVHEGLRWQCEYCMKKFTRASAAKQHSCRLAMGRPCAFRSVIIPLPVTNAATINANANANNAINDHHNSISNN